MGASNKISAAIISLTLLWSIFAPIHAVAGEVVSDVSKRDIAIDWDFRGAEIILFGAIDPVDEKSKSDVVIVVQGPYKNLVARKKARIAGMWINNEAQTVKKVPSYYSVLSTRPLSDIASKNELSPLRIGLQHLKSGFKTDGSESDDKSKKSDFKEAVVRLKRREGLYAEQPGGVTIIGDRLFRAKLTLPTNVPVGRLTANIYLFREGQLTGRQISTLNIRKQGIEHTITELAFNYPFIYGVLCVLIAVAAGLSASVFSRGR